MDDLQRKECFLVFILAEKLITNCIFFSQKVICLYQVTLWHVIMNLIVFTERSILAFWLNISFLLYFFAMGSLKNKIYSFLGSLMFFAVVGLRLKLFHA